MPRPALYHVKLTREQRTALTEIAKNRNIAETLRTRASILLGMDENASHPLTRDQVMEQTGASRTMVNLTIRNFCLDGLEKVMRIRRPAAADQANRKIDGAAEAKLIAKACSAPPDGRTRWTLKLLQEEMKVVLEYPISQSAISRTLRKNAIRPHKMKYYCIPSAEDPGFVDSLEDVLDVYSRPYDSRFPVVCIDEKPKDLHGEAREPIPARPKSESKDGRDQIKDSEYIRNGHCCIFVMIEPATGRIMANPSKRRTAKDFAMQLKYLSDIAYPDAEKIILVMDNLNTHTTKSLYKTFPAAEAHRLKNRFEIHKTPVHGSWVNIAELGIQILSTQCLNQRFPTFTTLETAVTAWGKGWGRCQPVQWKFTTTDARTKLARLYPKIISESTDKNPS